MNRTTRIAVGVAAVAAAGVAVAMVAGGRAATGSLQLSVRMSTAARIPSIERVISGNGITPLTDTIAVRASTTADEVVAGIPAGDGYSVELEAAAANGAVTCKGGADVDIVAGTTVQVNVIMQCSDAKAPEGATTSGRRNRCPVITSLQASPTTGRVNGGTIALRVNGSDADGDGVTFQWVQRLASAAGGTKVGALDPKVEALDSRSAGTAFTCGDAGSATLTVTASDGTCNDTASVTVSCAETPGELTPTASAPGATASALSAKDPLHRGAVGSPGAAPAPASAGTRGPASATGALLAADTPRALLAAGLGEQPDGTKSSARQPTVPRPGVGMPDGGSPAALCQLCAFGPDTSPLCGTTIPQGCANCNATTDGCDKIADEEERELCEAVLGCFVSHAQSCVVQGDPLRCWCGTNPTTCVTANEGATRANGVCVAEVFAAARTEDAALIRQRFVDARSALGRAVLITQCLGTFCSKECGFP